MTVSLRATNATYCCWCHIYLLIFIFITMTMINCVILDLARSPSHLRPYLNSHHSRLDFIEKRRNATQILIYVGMCNLLAITQWICPFLQEITSAIITAPTFIIEEFGERFIDSTQETESIKRSEFCVCVTSAVAGQCLVCRKRERT